MTPRRSDQTRREIFAFVRDRIAAGAPPMWTFTWALSIRRSPAASETTAARSEVSQKTCIEMRGIAAICSCSGARRGEGGSSSSIML